jgi:hypothetical protein
MEAEPAGQDDTIPSAPSPNVAALGHIVTAGQPRGIKDIIVKDLGRHLLRWLSTHIHTVRPEIAKGTIVLRLSRLS